MAVEVMMGENERDVRGQDSLVLSRLLPDGSPGGNCNLKASAMRTVRSYQLMQEQVGKELAEVYWAPGNGAAFLDLVQQLTGTPLAADAWIKHLEQPLEQLLEQERAAYAEAVAAGPRLKPGEEPDIGMRVLLVHGDEVIADSADAGLAAAVAKFKAWVRATFFPVETAAAT
ncbi:uncharacterized protein HaLaN_04198 [Haematococcus lacustris]|uniref:Uncharacterized protein n=1 Tax=Haematococcus lacustris TaxID=44745 RepID=A0A699YI11_HAELA|nr:uncharacterized protein HaLaN_04198 [Haematococcus lacustris]